MAGRYLTALLWSLVTMTPQARLGGFKILKDVLRISLLSPKQTENFPLRLCQAIAEEQINLPYITAANEGGAWAMNIIVDASNGSKATQRIQAEFGPIFANASESAILSIFPHKSDPTITGSLLEVFEQEGIDPDGYANSPSAISVVLKRGIVKRASNALFGPFSFSAYRTPADWKLAQKGKEQLYKEVVASYQEKRPKVYGLEYQEGQELLQIGLKCGHMGSVGTALKEFARLGLYLTFFNTSPGQEKGRERLFICLPKSEGHSNTEIITRIASAVKIETIFPVATFAMNGPHFGDRYGIASELLHALDKEKVALLGLNCSIASIIGVVPSPQIQSAINALQKCFEVPSLVKKDH
jgi:aspartokinase